MNVYAYFYLCVLILYISPWTYSLQSTPNDKFFEKLFRAIFTSQSFCQKSAERKSPKKYSSFSSNKPAHYLLVQADFNTIARAIRTEKTHFAVDFISFSFYMINTQVVHYVGIGKVGYGKEDRHYIFLYFIRGRKDLCWQGIPLDHGDFNEHPIY